MSFSCILMFQIQMFSDFDTTVGVACFIRDTQVWF